MKLVHFIAVFVLFHLAASAGPKKKEIKVDNRIICVKGKKGAKLSEIEYVGVTRTSVDLQAFMRQFSHSHVVPRENKKSFLPSPKFVKECAFVSICFHLFPFEILFNKPTTCNLTNCCLKCRTLTAIGRRECRKFQDKKLAKDEVYGIIFPNGRDSTLLSLFHDQDFKFHGAPEQLRYVFEELANYESA